MLDFGDPFLTVQLIPISCFPRRWKSFKRQMLSMRSHSDLKGIELKRQNDSIYSYPCPDCMCKVNKTEDLRTLSSSAT